MRTLRVAVYSLPSARRLVTSSRLYETRDVTSLLQIPLWLAFPIIVASFVLLALVSVLNLMTDMKGARA